MEFKLGIFCIVTLLAHFAKLSNASDNPCGDWEPFTDEKCFKVFTNLSLQNFAEAEKICAGMEAKSSSSLITIRFAEEEEFVMNLLKTQEVSNDVWIGLKYANHRYHWEDNVEPGYTNWAVGSPKNRSDHCVQMQTEEGSYGKWSDELCTRKNVVACQKIQTWTLAHLQKLVLNTIKNPFPVGFVYVQLPDQSDPKTIWPWMMWKDITTQYAGLFFRAEGGDSAKFGTIQPENIGNPLLNATYFFNSLSKCKDAGGICSQTGSAYNEENYKAYTNFNLTISEHPHPRNTAIRIWKRTG